MQPSLAERARDPAAATGPELPDRTTHSGGLSDRGLAWLLLIGGLVGLAASFVLAVEKYALLADPTYVPTCSLNPVLSCGSVMASAQAEAFGFPNPLLGVAGFPVVAGVGAALLAGARAAPWFWGGLQVGVTAGAVFVHWLIVNSLYSIGALCPYCMAVWAVTIPICWYVTLHNLDRVAARLPRRLAVAVAAAKRFHGVVLTAWFLLIAVAVLEEFWLYWSTFLG
ncbi:Vitamin K epoxide reductase [Modestobacter italicus]|uniref:Vitamin K epoxide reductase n=1 Tax=Modestobacter italicus (strain DSM 44449 / CECT 9708 / BC 501) TaxID=2732864 RepID=I4EVH2_MODI5|nr:vitamin K epoxide reductase family protein [Modestobacter marinus]CCH87385.1 Vitamin K epoxide reductase [Modestobacter marinus]